jgi:hypothetical protein
MGNYLLDSHMGRLNFSFFLLIVLFTSCGEKAPEGTVSQKPEAVKVSNLSLVENIFKDISSDTLYVFSDYENAPGFQFKGKAMDSLQAYVLPYEIRNKYSFYKDFGACYKFEMEPGKIAMIARVPGEFSSTAVKLFLFDVKKDSVINFINLSDVFGDAGEWDWGKSCIFKDGANGKRLLTYCYFSYQNPVGDENSSDTLTEVRNKYFLLDLSGKFGDTLSKDSAEISNKYARIVKKLEGK